MQCVRRVLLFGLALLSIFRGSPAAAVVAGTPPSLFQSFTVQGSAEITGNTLMILALNDPRVNDTLLDPTLTWANLSGIPINAKIEGAWVFYSGRTDVVADNTFDFYTPDGLVRPLVAGMCRNLSYGGESFFYCRRSVTTELRAASAARGGDVNGVYNVNNVQARVGVPGTLGNGCDFSDPNCQAAYAGWSMVVVWSSDVAPGVRNILLYDGFLALDETTTSGISAPITISGFNVGSPAGGELSYFALEGDPHLGSPPGGPEWADFMRFTSQSGASTLLQGAAGPPRNLFNSTVQQAGVPFNGVDLDAFDLGPNGLNLISPGDSSASITPGSGDGILDGGQEGELFMLGWVLMGIDTIAPSLAQGSSKRVDKTSASAGETLTYTLVIENTGNDVAPSVIVQDAPPPGTTYIPGTTTLDGTSVADVGAISLLLGGLNIGDLDYRLGTTTRRTLTFQVAINAGTADGVSICNQATADSARSAVVTLTTSPCTTVQAPQLRDPQELSVTDLNGGSVEPGDRLRYRVRLYNDGNQPARGLRYQQDLPPHVKSLSVLTVPPGSNDASSATGGQNGTGAIDVTTITVPGNFSVEVLYEVTIFTEAELIAAGVASSAIDGLLISTQGKLSALFLPLPIVTDDPATAATPDATDLRLAYAADLTASRKGGVDDDGAPLQGLDTITYTITLRNTGNRPATAAVVDDLPAGVELCTVVSSPAPATCSSSGGANGTGQLTASGLPVPAGGQAQIVFRVRVRADAADGTVVRNRVRITAPEVAGTITRTSSPLTVLNRVILSTSTKAVADPNGAPVEPGDLLDYTITVRNTGNRIATSVVVDDPVDANLIVVSAGQGGVISGAGVRWSVSGTPALASLAPGASVRLDLRVRVVTPLANNTVIANQATMSAPELSGPARTDDPSTAVAGDPTRVTVTSLPTFVLQKRAIDLDGAPLRPGDRLRYEITLRNTGPGLATAVVLRDPLPADTTLVRIENGGALQGGAVRWTFPTLGISPAGDRTVAFEVDVATPLPDGTVISNQAQVSSAERSTPMRSDDPDTGAPGDPTRRTVSAQADLSATTKTVVDLDGGAHLPGDAVRYTLILTNTGDAPARNVVVSDPIAACLTSVVPAGGGVFAAGQITWSAASTPGLARVDPGRDVQLTFDAILDPGLPDGTLCANQATVLSSDLVAPTPTDDPATASVDDATVILVESRPVLEESEKRIVLVLDRNGDGAFSPGDRVRYVIDVRNTGTETALGVQVRDPLPPELSGVSLSPAGSVVGGEARWSLGNLLAGASRTLRVEGDVVAPLDDGTLLVNQAFLSRTGRVGEVPTDDPTTPTLDDPTVQALTAAPDLSGFTLTATDPNGAPLRPGDLLDYQLTLRNDGTALARQLTVRLPLDANVAFVSASAGGIFDPATSELSWSLGDLALGAAAARTLTVQVRLLTPLDNGTRITAQAEAVATTLGAPVLSDDPATAPLDDPTVRVVVSGADLGGATKTVSDPNGGDLRPGDVLVWTLTITNTGDAVARNVTVDDAFDGALTGLSPQQGGVRAGPNVHWDATTTPALLAVAPGETRTLVALSVVRTPLDDGTVIANQALVSADGLVAPVPTDDPGTAALDDPTTITVRAAADLSTSTKTFTAGGGLPVHPGDLVTWTLRAINTGDALARATTFGDLLDPSLTFVSASDGGTFDPATRVVRFTLGDVAPGAPVTRTLITRVVLPLDDGTLISNQGLIASSSLPGTQPTDDPSTAPLGDPTTFSIESAPDLGGSTKVVVDRNGGDVAPGDLLDYTVTLENRGDMIARGVLTLDALDPLLVNITPQDGGSYAAGAHRITWSARDLSPADAPVTLRFTARIAALTADGTVIANQAVLQAAGLSLPTDDPSTPAPDDSTDVVVVSAPDLTTTQKRVVDDDGGLLLPGDALTYTIVVKNTGNTYATAVRVVDPIDPKLTNIQPAQGGVLQGQSIVWEASTTPALAQVAPGASNAVTLTFTATVALDAKDGDTILNQARVQAAELAADTLSDDPATPAPSDPTQIVLSLPDLSASTKTVENLDGGPTDPVEPGDRLRWSITLRNQGSYPATGISVRDAIDPALLIDPSPVGGTMQGNEAVWTVNTLGPGEQQTFVFTTTVADLLANGTVIENQAQLTFLELPAVVPTDDPATPAQDDPTSVVVSSAPKLRVQKAVEDLSGDVVVPGDALRYTITLENTGNTYATDVEIVDVLPAVIETFTAAPPARIGGQRVVWGAAEVPALARLAPGTPLTFTLDVVLRKPLSDGVLVTNQARVNLNEQARGVPSDDPATPAVDDPTSVRVFSAPRFTHSEKTVVDLDGGLVEPGDLLEYTVLVINDGTEDAVGTVLQDATPPSTHYVAGSTSLNGVPIPDPPLGGSPLISGLPVRSARPGTAPGVLLVSDGQAPDDEIAVVSFRVQVVAEALGGTEIANQGQIASLRSEAVGTDDPGTAAAGDATVVVVGRAILLSDTTKGWRFTRDEQTPGVAEPGDRVAFEIVVPNRGTAAATAVEIRDTIPAGTRYLPSTLTLDGRALTDAPDGDPGQVLSEAGAVVVQVVVPIIRPRAIATVRFEVELLPEAGPTVVNQAQVSARDPGGARIEVASDADLAVPGDQPTVIPVGDAPVRDLSTSVKAVVDLDGGVVERGDLLRYRLVARNTGNVAITGIQIEDVLPPHTIHVSHQIPVGVSTRFENAPAGDGRGILFATFDRPLEAGRSFELAFEVRVAADAPDGALISNSATLSADALEPRVLGPAVLVVGAAPGTGGYAGRVFLDADHDGVAGPEEAGLQGFNVSAIAPDGEAIARSVVSDARGDFVLVGLPVGPWTLRISSASGTTFAEVEAPAFTKDAVVAVDGPVDPSGVVYRGDDGSGVAGARVWLLYGPERVGQPPLPCDEDPRLVSLETDPAIGASEARPLPRPIGFNCLRSGQQGQRTPRGDAAGFYRFDVPRADPAMDYQLQVVPPAPQLAFPSILRPASPGVAPAGEVVPGERPDLGADTTWYHFFRIGGPEDAVTHNHVPLDPVRDLVQLTKVAARGTATVGELVAYTVTLKNRSNTDLRVSGGADPGGTGVRIQDLIPDGMRYVAGTAVASRLRTAPGGGLVRACPRVGEDSIGCPSERPAPEALLDTRRFVGEVLTFGPFDLLAGERLELRYVLAVGADAKPGDASNLARAVLDGVALGDAEAVVRIVRDPLFDEGTVLGRVFCDDNEDGRQQPVERGLIGAKVWVDTGVSSVADRDGKLHFSRVEPGLRLFKLDPASLPPASGPLGPAGVPLYLTRGLDTRVTFPVRCAFARMRPTQLGVMRPRAAPSVLLTVAASPLALQVGDDATPLPKIAARMVAPGAQARFDEPALPLALGEGLPELHLESEGEIRRWRVEIARMPGPEAGEAGLIDPAALPRIFVREGEGAPPATMSLPESLPAGEPLLLWAGVEGSPGVAMRSAAQVFARGWVPPPMKPVDLTLEGKLFPRRGAKPTTVFKTAAAPVLVALKQNPDARVKLEVHVDASYRRRALRLSRARAGRVKAWLVSEGIAPGRIEAVGKGSKAPLVPNIGRRNQRKNRRVHLLVRAPDPEIPSLPAFETSSEFLIGGTERDLDESGTFSDSLEVQRGGRLGIALGTARGERLGLLRRIDAEGLPVVLEAEDPEAEAYCGEALRLAGLRFDLRPEASRASQPEATAPAPVDGAGISGGAGKAQVVSMRLELPRGGAVPLLGWSGPQASVRHALPLLAVTGLREDEDGLVKLGKGGLPQRPLTFLVKIPGQVRVARWSLAIEDRSGAEVGRVEGEGSPPARIRWDGRAPSGEPALARGEGYRFRLGVTDEVGNTGKGAVGAFAVADRGRSRTLSGLFSVGARIAPNKRAPLKAFARQVKAMGRGTRVTVVAHTDNSGGPEAARTRTDKQAAAVARLLSSLGVPTASIRQVFKGDTEPLVPNLTPRNRERNKRIVLRAAPPRPRSPKAQPSSPSIRVGEVEMVAEKGGRVWTATVPLGDPLELRAVTADGREAVYRIALQPASSAGAGAGAGGDLPGRALQRPPAFGAGAPRLAGRTGPGRALLAQGTRLGDDEEDEDGADEDDAPGGLRVDSPSPSSQPSVSASSALDGDPSSSQARHEESPAPRGGTRLGDDDDDEAEDEDDAPGGGLALAPPAPKPNLKQTPPELSPLPEAKEELELRVLDRAEIDVKAVPIADSFLVLPPAGIPLKGPRLPLYGRTAPGAIVQVGSVRLPVDRDGRFAGTVEIPRGDSLFSLRIHDEVGNEAIFEREMQREAEPLFVMALADTAMGLAGAQLDGVGSNTRVDLGPVWLHGRAAAYLRGAWKPKRGPFDDLKLELHVDTARFGREAMFRELVDPDRSYLLYGDTGEEDVVAEAYGPLWLQLKADESELTFGNVETRLGTGGLFDYRRTLYGGRLHLDETLGEKMRTEVDAFASAGELGQRPGHAVMQGTGGSLYFLPDRDVVEGSERVVITVRDRETGIILFTRPLVRNVDYTFRFDQGQLFLKSPLPSVAHAGWLGGSNAATPLDDHPVFLVIDYNHLARPGEGLLAAGGYVRETYDGWLTLGGGLLAQDVGPSSTPYRLYGLLAEIRPKARSYLRLELAASEGTDLTGAYSADGGLSYAGLLPGCESAEVVGERCGGKGRALALEGSLSLGELLGKTEDIVLLTTRLELQDAGFYNSQRLLDQGQSRGGVMLSWKASKHDDLLARFDFVSAQIPTGATGTGQGRTKGVQRSSYGLRYARTGEKWRAFGEWNGAVVRDDELGRLSSDRVLAGGEFDLSRGLTLLVDQDLTLGGDTRVFEAIADRLSTGLGLRYRLTDDLEVSVVGRVRWSGENAVTAGARVRTGESGSVYANERLVRPVDGSWRSTSVVGTEQAVGPLNTHGELQLDGGFGSTRGRAVMGLGHTFTPMEGLRLDFSYERVQVIGDVGSGSALPGSTVDPVNGRSTTTGRVDGLPPFASVGLNPAGSFYPGAVSRDAVSAAVAFSHEVIESSLRLELRYDNADDTLVDQLSGVADRVQGVVAGNLAWHWNRDLALIGRLNWLGTHNLDLGLAESLWMESSLGLAYRPVEENGMAVLFKATHLVDQRPLDLALGTSDRQTSQILSLAPVFETPWRLALAEKVAYKRTQLRVGIGEGLVPPEVVSHALLWVNRLDFHATEHFDLSAEYRILWVSAGAKRETAPTALSGGVRSGAVFEAAYRMGQNFRFGAGYSFASFSDDELARFDTDSSGPFLRITGIY